MDVGSVPGMDGRQLPWMAVLAPALEKLLGAPMSSRSRSAGLTLVAEVVGAAASCSLVKTLVSLA